MRGLMPRSLPSPIPYNPVLTSGSSCSLVCGDLCLAVCATVQNISGQIRLLWEVFCWDLRTSGLRCCWPHTSHPHTKVGRRVILFDKPRLRYLWGAGFTQRPSSSPLSPIPCPLLLFPGDSRGSLGLSLRLGLSGPLDVMP